MVSEFSPDPVQTPVEQGFGGAEGRLARISKNNDLGSTNGAMCMRHVYQPVSGSDKLTLPGSATPYPKATPLLQPPVGEEDVLHRAVHPAGDIVGVGLVDALVADGDLRAVRPLPQHHHCSLAQRVHVTGRYRNQLTHTGAARCGTILQPRQSTRGNSKPLKRQR